MSYGVRLFRFAAIFNRLGDTFVSFAFIFGERFVSEGNSESLLQAKKRPLISGRIERRGRLFNGESGALWPVNHHN